MYVHVQQCQTTALPYIEGHHHILQLKVTMATQGEISPPEETQDVGIKGTKAIESIKIVESGEISPPEDSIQGATARTGGIGDISPPETLTEDVIEGARAINPDITIEELTRLAQDPETLEKIKSAKEFKFIVIGKTGTGKSTLIYGLIGAEVAEVTEGVTTTGVTTKVESYSRKINDIEILAYDSPGLEDGSGNEKTYLEEIYKACQQGMDLVVFAIQFQSRFVPDNPDARAIVKFTKKLKPAIWEKTIVILTHSNLCEALNPKLRYKSREEKQAFFKQVISDYKTVIHQTLLKAGVPAATVEKVKVVPTGIEYEAQLLDSTLWFSNFWLECLTAISTLEGRATMFKAHSSRLKSDKDVTDEDFQQPIHSQPIIMKTSILVSVGGVMGPGVAGAAVGALGLLGGPVGAVTIPLGFFVGVALGAVGTAI